MSRYARHNPDEPISHDWLSSERREELAEHLRDMRRDAAAEAALPLPGLEPGIETISPGEPARSTGEAAQNQQQPGTSTTKQL